MASYLTKWSNGEKRPKEEAEVVAATQKRKSFAKPEELIKLSQYAGLSLSFFKSI